MGLMVVAALLGHAVACVLPLDNQIACGDGFVDVSAGEECDPVLDLSFEGRCGEETASRCNPETCRLECGECGDGILDAPFEECEADVPFDDTCDGPGSVSCIDCEIVRIDCDVACGNGRLEPTEVCDYNLDAFTTEEETDCTGREVPGNPGKTYTEGRRTCQTDCTWDLSRCSLCGDGSIDDAIVDPATDTMIRPAELCDGQWFRDEAAVSECSAYCPGLYVGVTCDVECEEGCLGIRVKDPDAPGCCLLPGAPSPPGAPPCCCHLDNPDDPTACNDFEAPTPGADPLCPSYSN